ncbi:DUF6559 family protein [Colwellia sp. MEBiC06753]
MFKYWSIKRYSNKFLPTLEQRYGKQTHYSAQQIRATVYQKDFNPKFLPLAYILFLTPEHLTQVMADECPDIDIAKYKKEMLDYLATKQYHGLLSHIHNIS